jgi:uncharacterized protein
MAEITRHIPGTFCWAELGTTNASAASRFYGELFGWRRSFMPVADGTCYTMLQLHGKDIGALYEVFDESPEFSPLWRLYVATPDVDKTAQLAVTLGGKIIIEPRNIEDVGRVAAVQDPTGASIALWQALDHIGAEVINESGSLAWQELVTSDCDTAKAFYSGLFGWQTQTVSAGPRVYTKFKAKRSEAPSAGLVPLSHQSNQFEGATASHWQAYFAVEDCDRSVNRAVSLGAQLKSAPTNFSGLGRCAVLRDPQGATFSLVQRQEASQYAYAAAA